MRQIGLIILLFFTSLAYAQNVEFKASAPSVVAVGEQFKLEYTLNKEGDNLKVPTLEGFDLLMGPSVGQSFYSSNINGKMTQNVTFSYTYILEGTKKGTFQIPGATVIIDGKEYTSNALKIEVVEGSRNSNGNQAATNRPVQPDANATVNDNNLFVKVEVSRRSLYMGESLMATIKVYTKVWSIWAELNFRISTDFWPKKYPRRNVSNWFGKRWTGRFTMSELSGKYCCIRNIPERLRSSLSSWNVLSVSV